MNLRSASGTILLGSVGLLLIAAAAWLMMLRPALSAVGEADQARADAQAQYDTLRVQLTDLRRQVAELPATGERAAELDRIFPPTADQAGFFEQVTGAALRAGLSADDVTTVSPGVPVLVSPDPAVPAEPAVPAAPLPEPADVLEERRGETGGEPAESADPTDPTDPTDPAAPVTPAAPAAPAATTAIQSVSVGVRGSYEQLISLIGQLEGIDRALLLQSVQISAGEEDSMTMTLTGTTFVAVPVGAPPDVRSTP